jgi:allantoin racemase
VIACFGDPGLLAARELTTAPVIGIAEAAFHLATLIASRFSIVTTLERTCFIAEHLLQAYGFEKQCRKVRAAKIPVLDLVDIDHNAYETILSECCSAKDNDKIGAIVLGCGAMSDITDKLQTDLQIPVIDGVTAAVKLAESLVSLGLGTSKHGDFAYPEPKQFTGNFTGLSK